MIKMSSLSVFQRERARERKEKTREKTKERERERGKYDCLMFLQCLSDIVVAILITSLSTALLSFQANRTATDLVSVIAWFQCFLTWHFELIVLIDNGHPVTELVGIIHAITIGSWAFNEWCCTEIFETRARAGQGLTTTLSTAAKMLWKETQVVKYETS